MQRQPLMMWGQPKMMQGQPMIMQEQPMMKPSGDAFMQFMCLYRSVFKHRLSTSCKVMGHRARIDRAQRYHLSKKAGASVQVAACCTEICCGPVASAAHIARGICGICGTCGA